MSTSKPHQHMAQYQHLLIVTASTAPTQHRARDAMPVASHEVSKKTRIISLLGMDLDLQFLVSRCWLFESNNWATIPVASMASCVFVRLNVRRLRSQWAVGKAKHGASTGHVQAMPGPVLGTRSSLMTRIA